MNDNILETRSHDVKFCEEFYNEDNLVSKKFKYSDDLILIEMTISGTELKM